MENRMSAFERLLGAGDPFGLRKAERFVPHTLQLKVQPSITLRETIATSSGTLTPRKESVFAHARSIFSSHLTVPTAAQITAAEARIGDSDSFSANRPASSASASSSSSSAAAAPAPLAPAPQLSVAEQQRRAAVVQNKRKLFIGRWAESADDTAKLGTTKAHFTDHEDKLLRAAMSTHVGQLTAKRFKEHMEKTDEHGCLSRAAQRLSKRRKLLSTVERIKNLRKTRTKRKAKLKGIPKNIWPSCTPEPTQEELANMSDVTDSTSEDN